jgi:hypothetical protein
LENSTESDTKRSPADHIHYLKNACGEVIQDMGTGTVPPSVAEALSAMETLAGFVADVGAADMPAEELAAHIAATERVNAVLAAALGRLLAAFDAKDGHLTDGQRTLGAWAVNHLGVTRGQAAEYKALEALDREHQVLRAGLREVAVTKSIALQLAKWTRQLPAEFRARAEDILIMAARAGANLRALAAIYAEIRSQTAPPDPDGPDPHLDRGLSLDTTFEGAGVLRADLTPECAAMVQAVLDALAAPQAGGDLRTRPQRYHDALEEAMKRLLASNLLPARAGQPTKALVHIAFPDLCQLDTDSVLQDTWIAAYRARWAAQRAAASVSPGDGGAWLEGDAARTVACDAIIVPVVVADLDPGAVEQLITICVEYDRLRGHAHQGGAAPEQAAAAGRLAEVLAMLEHQILGQVIQIVSGPGGVASFLRQSLLGKGLNGPSLPLDVGQTDDIPVHLRRLVALRDQHCQFPGGCDRPASGCQAHHVIHRSDGGPTSLWNLKDYCTWHHLVLLHQLGWKLTVHPDGTSQARSPAGKVIRSHSPPPRPG